MDAAASLETALVHACANVTIAEPNRPVAEVRRMIAGRRYECASHVVVVHEDNRFAGIVRIEDLLAASGDAAISTVMDADPPTVGPGVDQEVAAWQAVRRGPPWLLPWRSSSCCAHWRSRDRTRTRAPTARRRTPKEESSGSASQQTSTSLAEARGQNTRVVPESANCTEKVVA